MPKRTTRSSCTPETEQGTHTFDIHGYSAHLSMSNMEFIQSCTFTVGGADWAVRFYPTGDFAGDGEPIRCTYVSAYLVLLTRAKVTASCDLGLVDHDTGLPTSVHRTPEPRLFNYGGHGAFYPQHGLFMDRGELEKSSFLRNDHLTIHCDVTVIRAPKVCHYELLNKVGDPPPGIAKQLGGLLDTGERSDVTFDVGGETFAAHKFVLALRSPVFKAEFYGPMREAKAKRVAIEDMRPEVFENMLRFIYTDSLQFMEGIWEVFDYDMTRDLLVAADRYDIERLKLVCQNILCKNLNVQNAVAMLTLAYQYNCDMLKNVCLEFITSSTATTNAVVATQSFENLKRSPSDALGDLLADVFRRASKLRKR